MDVFAQFKMADILDTDFDIHIYTGKQNYKRVLHRIPVCTETISIGDGDKIKLTCAKCK